MATKGKVTGVIANMVLLAVDGPVAQNEICYIKTGGDRLMQRSSKLTEPKCMFRYSRVHAV
jgi:V/A-type H+-transporting ATPase subunit A